MSYRAGNRIGPWFLQQRIGRGGFGEVFLAQRSDGKRAAVKVLNSSEGFDPDPETHQRFEQELKLLKRLDSDRTARVIDADTRRRPPWIATEYIAGQSLEEEISHDGPLEGELWWDLVFHLLQGLDKAHRTGVIHRDIKPGNIMRGARGSVIIDFGASLILDGGHDRITRDAAPMTVLFASPEQLQGRDVSEATDIFSAGLTLAFAALGEPLFDGVSLGAIVGEIIEDEPDYSRLSGSQSEFLKELLKKAPGERPSAKKAENLARKSRREDLNIPIARSDSPPQHSARHSARQPDRKSPHEATVSDRSPRSRQKPHNQPQVNVTTGLPYPGTTHMYLEAVARNNGWTDNRWISQEEIDKRGGVVKKGQRPARLTDWLPNYKTVIDEDGNEVQVLHSLSPMEHFVYNAEQVDGL